METKVEIKEDIKQGSKEDTMEEPLVITREDPQTVTKQDHKEDIQEDHMEAVQEATKVVLASKITGLFLALQEILNNRDPRLEDIGVLPRVKAACQVIREASPVIHHSRAEEDIKDFLQVTKGDKQEQVLNIKDGVLLNELQNH